MHRFKELSFEKTKIIATVGPSCQSAEGLESLIREGVDVFRINSSHTTQKELIFWIKLIQKISTQKNKLIPILLDLQGPRVRTGPLQANTVRLLKGQTVSIVTSPHAGNSSTITTAIRQFPQIVKKGDPILIDNGSIRLKVISVSKGRVKCIIQQGGLLGENKGINLPHAPVTLPALSKRDKMILSTALKHGVDYIALSFVRSQKDVKQLKRFLAKKGKSIPVIAKIEKPRALEHLDDILQVSDGIMVARGDLGIEMGVEKVPSIQKNLIRKANIQGIPVITATQMLESMMQNPYPTRAEASDIANAVLDQTDAVMLSGETSVGDYPIETVKVMSKIINETEKGFVSPQQSVLPSSKNYLDTVLHAISSAARDAAANLQARAIVVFTQQGQVVRYISKLRPACPIIGIARSHGLGRELRLLWGVIPLIMPYSNNLVKVLRQSDTLLLKQKIVKNHDPVIIVSGKQSFPGFRYINKIHRVGVY